jgi:hypothetical protein
VWDVYQGNFSIIKNYETKSIVIVDCGSSNLSFDKFCSGHAEEMIDLFRDCRLDAIIITHPDKDHYSFLCEGLLRFMRGRCSIRDVIFFLGGGFKNTNCEKECLTAFRQAKVMPRIQMYSCDIYDDSFTCRNIIEGGDLDIDVIEESINLRFFGLECSRCSGDYDKFSFCKPIFGIRGSSSHNDQSLVFCLCSSGGNILFTGDATQKTFNAIGYDVGTHVWNQPSYLESMRKIQRDNFFIISHSNFVVIPHHGACTAGSDLILFAIINAAETNFVGAAVSANPGHSSPGHPTKKALAGVFPLSAQQIGKVPLVRHHERGDQMRQVDTHRVLFMPCLLPGGFLWLKLENGLSIFDNEVYLAYIERGDPDQMQPLLDFFTPFTFKAIYEDVGKSVYDYIDKVIVPEINITDELRLPDGLKLTYQLISSIIVSNSASLFWNNQFAMDVFDRLESLAKTLLLFTVRLIAKDNLSIDELIVRGKVSDRYGEMSKRYIFSDLIKFLFNLDDPECIEVLPLKAIQSISYQL